LVTQDTDQNKNRQMILLSEMVLLIAKMAV